MRILTLSLVFLLAFAAPAVADDSAVFKTIKVSDQYVINYQLNPNFAPHQPEHTKFTVKVDDTSVITTKGDPILFIGGRKLGHWPYKHLTYRFKGGLEITGHADKKDGNVHSMEVYCPDGTMLKITGMDTGKVKVVKLSKYSTWVYKKLFRKKTFILDLSLD